MSDIWRWREAIAYLCEAKGISPDRVLAEPGHNEFKVTASGGAVWMFLTPDLQYGGLTDRTVVLSAQEYAEFLQRADGGQQG